MKRINAQDHAKALIRTNGLDVALRIAERSVHGTSPLVENELPRSSKGGSIFFPEDKKNGTRLAIRNRQRTHGFWLQVKGILNKLIKR